MSSIPNKPRAVHTVDIPFCDHCEPAAQLYSAHRVTYHCLSCDRVHEMTGLPETVSPTCERAGDEVS